MSWMSMRTCVQGDHEFVARKPALTFSQTQMFTLAGCKIWGTPAGVPQLGLTVPM